SYSVSTIILYLGLSYHSSHPFLRPLSSLFFSLFFFFFFNDTATTEIYTLSLHDALPISGIPRPGRAVPRRRSRRGSQRAAPKARSEEHTSELQSPDHLVCRLLLEKKKKKIKIKKKKIKKKQRRSSYETY